MNPGNIHSDAKNVVLKENVAQVSSYNQQDSSPDWNRRSILKKYLYTSKLLRCASSGRTQIKMPFMEKQNKNGSKNPKEYR